MKKNVYVFVMLFAFSLCAKAQTQKKILKVVTLVPQRSIYLNGGARSSVGGKSRTSIPVTLPPNTKSWHYSFSTSPGESGTKNLNLAIQLSSLVIDPTGLSKKMLQGVEAPAGSASIDISVLDKDNVRPFEEKVDLKGGTYKLYTDLSVANTRQAVISINTLLEGTYYLGLKNPSALNGVNVFIEVVAITEEFVARTEEEEQAFSLGNLAWKAFERGDYDKCLVQSKKAIALDPSLGFVHFNIALSYLMKGQSDIATDEYAKAISLTKKTVIPKETFKGAINDLKTYMPKFPNQNDAKDILDLLEAEYKNY